MGPYYFIDANVLFFYDSVMKKILAFILLSSSTFSYAASIKKLQRKLSKELSVDLKISSSLIKSKDYCSKRMLESWLEWWDEVEPVYKDNYRAKLKNLSEISLLRSEGTQSIEGTQKQLHLIKTICTGGPLSRSCKSKESRSFKFDTNLKLNGTTPKFEMLIGSSAKIYLEFAEDSSALKRYDTFSQKAYFQTEENKKLFANYYKAGIITQIIKPGTDTSKRTICSYPNLADLILKLN